MKRLETRPGFSKPWLFFSSGFETSRQFRLAVRGHFLLVLDDSGSRVALREDELIGMEVFSKPGSEGIPPLIGLKKAEAAEGASIAATAVAGKSAVVPAAVVPAVPAGAGTPAKVG